LTETQVPASGKPTLWGLNGYQWAVLFAAWLGWGFDVFDGLLFNYVSKFCVPDLLHLHAAPNVIARLSIIWTARATSVLLIGWGLGGLMFGRIADRIGRSRTLLFTIMLYGVGTAACALAPSMPLLFLFRFISALGIGGEWAAGSALVAEVVPEKRRVEAGALLYTSASAGLFLAVTVNKYFSTEFGATRPDLAWRYVMACGLIPVAFTLMIRFLVKEPERWKNIAGKVKAATISDLFLPENRRLTLSGFLPAVVSLITWWSCNSFIQIVASNMAGAWARAHGFDKLHSGALAQNWIEIASNSFNLGGLIGTLATIPLAKVMGRKTMFVIYFVLSGVSLLAAFGHQWSPYQQLLMYFPIGLTVFGVFGSYTFYLPELFPTHIRGTGAGFCYNVGRLITAVGPLLVAQVAISSDPVAGARHALFYVGFVPLIGLLFLPWIIETKGKDLTD